VRHEVFQEPIVVSQGAMVVSQEAMVVSEHRIAPQCFVKETARETQCVLETVVYACDRERQSVEETLLCEEETLLCETVRDRESKTSGWNGVCGV